MAGRDGPVADATIVVRIPEHLKTLLEAIAVSQCNTLSYIIRRLLESHPAVVFAAEMVYAQVKAPDERESSP